MNLGAYFKRNPFQNLIVATKETFNFQLRGHEDMFEERMGEINKAVLDKEYKPENLQHTIVFGEWGHGKTHFLRSIENKVNSLDSSVRAVFYEPTVVTPEGIFQELCSIIDIGCSTAVEFIESLRKHYAHFFLLIDESQSMVGEDIEKTVVSDSLTKYYQFLYELIKTAEHYYYNLHIFHGFSANSAKAIDGLGKMDFVKKLSKHIFTLNSLSEENQWDMICDHIHYTLQDDYRDTIETRTLIDREVNQCINKLTGGNPRWALMLMNEIYNAAFHRLKIDASVCFETLSRTSRIDDPGQKYFDPFIINNVLGLLNQGLSHEQTLAQLFRSRQAHILGAWGKLSQADVDEFGLKAGTIRKSCPTLKGISVFTTDEDGDFNVTQKFLDEIKIFSPRTIFEAEDREIQIRLTFEPEEYLRPFADGMERILRLCYYPVAFRETRVGLSKLDMLCVDTIPDNESSYRVRIGIIIFKGMKIPYKVFEAAEKLIIKGSCDATLFIEDTELSSYDNSSDFTRFIADYKGILNISKRFVFIRGIIGEQIGFGEQFFVKLAKAHKIEIEGARQLLESIQIPKVIEKICNESVYCPDEMERILIERLITLKGSRTIAEIKSLDTQFTWVNRERLTPLAIDYLEKTGSKYCIKSVKDVKPFKFVLKAIKDESNEVSLESLHQQFRLELLLTGNDESKKAAVLWIIGILEKEGFIETENHQIKFKDIDRDIEECEQKFIEIRKQFISQIGQFGERGLNEDHFRIIAIHFEELSDEYRNNSLLKNSEKMNYKHKLDGWLQVITEQYRELEKVKDIVRKQLRAEIYVTEAKLKEMLELIEPYEGIELPINRPFRTFKNELEELESELEQDIPREQFIRTRNIDLRQNLDAMKQLVSAVSDRAEYLENDTVNNINKGKLFLSIALIRKFDGKVSLTYCSEIEE